MAYVDVLENADNLEAMMALTNGNRRVPVIVDGETVAIGFNGRS